MQTVGWLNQNRYRVYPFVENTVVDLPNNFLLDFHLLVYTNRAEPSAVQLTTMVLDGSDVTLTFTDTTYSYTVTVPYVAATPYEARVTVNAGGEHYDLMVVIGEGLADVAARAPGTYNLSAAIEPALAQYQTRHRVLSITGTVPGSVPVTGDIYFKEGHGVSVAVAATLDQVRLAAYPGGGTGFPCDEMPRAYLDVIQAIGAAQPDGWITLDGYTFQFGTAPDGSGSGTVDPSVIYVPLGATALDSFNNLYAAFAVLSAELETFTDTENHNVIRMYRDNALLRNMSQSLTNLAVELVPVSDLDCSRSILSINDVTPDGYGNMQLAGGKGIAIINDPAGHKITIRNKLDPDNAGCGVCAEGAPNA